MYEQASSMKRKASDCASSPVAKSNASSVQHHEAKAQKSNPAPVEGDAGVKEAKANLPNRLGRDADQAAALSSPSDPSPSIQTKDLVSRYGDSRHRRLEDFGYFVDPSRLAPILSLVQDLSGVWHSTFSFAEEWLEEMVELWPNGLIPAQGIIIGIHDAFRDTEYSLSIVTDVRSGMLEQTQLQWWADAEYDITLRLPQALIDLTGIGGQNVTIEGKDVSSIIGVVRRMAELDEFNLPQFILNKLPKNNAPPSLLLDTSDVFDAKLDAVRRQVLNVTLKYRLFRGTLKPLEELVEQLEEEVKCHKQNIIESAWSS